MIKRVHRWSSVIAIAAKGNSLIAIGNVFMFYIFYNFASAIVETLFWGDRFTHVGDVVAICFFSWLAWHSCKACASLHFNAFDNDPDEPEND